MVAGGVAFFLGVVPVISAAQEGTEQAQDARLLWSAFECSYFAFSSDQEAEGIRLFELGYDRGRAFIDALLAGEIGEEDARRFIPVGISLRLEGPSSDFALGRIFEATQSEAAAMLSAANPDFPFDEELRRLSAENLYGHRNCEIIE
jgi:hypothetical protein